MYLMSKEYIQNVHKGAILTQTVHPISIGSSSSVETFIISSQLHFLVQYLYSCDSCTRVLIPSSPETPLTPHLLVNCMHRNINPL